MEDKILIVEDEVKIASLLNDYMKDTGYSSVMLHHGDEVLPWLENNSVDLILLDLMLPGTSGIDICKEIRKTSNTPIIMITAKVEEIDRLVGLELGADDYICKPFSPREVVARAKAVLRRSKLNNLQNSNKTVESDSELQESSLSLNENNYKLTHNDKAVELTAVEFKLFQALYSQPGHIYSREKLMNCIYDDHRIVSDRTVDSHVKKIRKKLNQIDIDDKVIHSIYGVGYKYE